MDYLTFKMTGKSVVSNELLKERRKSMLKSSRPTARISKIYIDEYNHEDPEYAPDPEIGIWGWEKE